MTLVWEWPQTFLIEVIFRIQFGRDVKWSSMLDTIICKREILVPYWMTYQTADVFFSEKFAKNEFSSDFF